jgi:hypothetical protein
MKMRKAEVKIVEKGRPPRIEIWDVVDVTDNGYTFEPARTVISDATYNICLLPEPPETGQS